MINLVEVAGDVVVPAMRAVFKDGEVTALELRFSHADEASLDLSITAQGETFKYPVIQGGVPDASLESWSENLRSLLVEFVAESRFGWGENRDAP